MSGDVILKAENLKKYYPIKAGVFRRTVGQVKAVDGVSFELSKGETLGIVGESGCGKSTLGRMLMRLEEPTEGKLTFDGIDVYSQQGAAMRRLRRDIQIVFQDPYTKGLLESIPRLDQKGQELAAIGGLPPNLMKIPPGCPFNPRCQYARDVCRVDPPPALRRVARQQLSACHFAEDLLAGVLEPTRVQDSTGDHARYVQPQRQAVPHTGPAVNTDSELDGGAAR